MDVWRYGRVDDVGGTGPRASGEEGFSFLPSLLALGSSPNSRPHLHTFKRPYVQKAKGPVSLAVETEPFWLITTGDVIALPRDHRQPAVGAVRHLGNPTDKDHASLKKRAIMPKKSIPVANEVIITRFARRAGFLSSLSWYRASHSTFSGCPAVITSLIRWHRSSVINHRSTVRIFPDDQ